MRYRDFDTGLHPLVPRKVQVVAKIDANFQLIVDRRGASPVRDEVT
jgi:hypothetical protein